jgi:Helix-turn-helix domain
MENVSEIMEPELTDKNPTAGQEVNPLERQTYTVEEAAKILGICRSLAYRRGVLPTVTVAGRRLVPKRALERMLAETM